MLQKNDAKALHLVAPRLIARKRANARQIGLLHATRADVKVCSKQWFEKEALQT
jgi:hypothetical protein